eukprot:scaffold18348_cov62-Phaeocystis_antarctica.AAC.5
MAGSASARLSEHIPRLALWPSVDLRSRSRHAGGAGALERVLCARNGASGPARGGRLRNKLWTVWSPCCRMCWRLRWTVACSTRAKQEGGVLREQSRRRECVARQAMARSKLRNDGCHLRQRIRGHVWEEVVLRVVTYAARRRRPQAALGPHVVRRAHLVDGPVASRRLVVVRRLMGRDECAANVRRCDRERGGEADGAEYRKVDRKPERGDSDDPR